MSGHTPGPWTVTNGTDVFTALGARNAGGLEANDSDGWYIADCAPGGTSVGTELVEMDSAEAKANARLITVSPRLLAFANEVATCLDAPGEPNLDWYINEAKKLVAEATGEQS